MTGRAIVFEGIAHQGPLVGVGAMACQAGRGRSFRIAGIGEILPEMACVIEFNRRAAVVGETIRELRVGLREVGEFFLVTGRALKIVERDDVGVHTLVLGMAHQAGGLRHIGPAGGFPVMGQSSRAFKAVTVGAIGGHVARCEHRLDPVHAAAVVIHMAHLAVGAGDEIRMGIGQGSGNRPIEADDVTVGRPHGTADKGQHQAQGKHGEAAADAAQTAPRRAGRLGDRATAIRIRAMLARTAGDGRAPAFEAIVLVLDRAAGRGAATAAIQIRPAHAGFAPGCGAPAAKFVIRPLIGAAVEPVAIGIQDAGHRIYT